MKVKLIYFKPSGKFYAEGEYETQLPADDLQHPPGARGTTHCRAGHAIDIAGPAGYELERKLGDSATAGAQIYMTGNRVRVPAVHATKT